MEAFTFQQKLLMEISFIKLEKDGISSAVKFTSESDMFAREEMYADGIIEEL